MRTVSVEYDGWVPAAENEDETLDLGDVEEDSLRYRFRDSDFVHRLPETCLNAPDLLKVKKIKVVLTVTAHVVEVGETATREDDGTIKVIRCDHGHEPKQVHV